MIRRFWVENYSSIRERQEMDFTASPKKEEWLCTEVSPGVKINKLGVLFGANASGKSNMLKAMRDAFSLLVTPRTSRDEKVKAGMPFALSSDKPTRMFVSFYANQIRYDYEIEYSRTRIIREQLDYYPQAFPIPVL